MARAVNPDPIDVAVGARIRMRRLQVGMSQSALADLIGVTFQQVQKYERGANRISASMLVRAARALQCPGAVLLEAPPAVGEEARSSDSLNAELAGLLAHAGAVDLLRAFVQIRNTDVRVGIMAVVRGLSSAPANAKELSRET